MLRDFQQEAEQLTYDAWNGGARNVMLVMPTGAGKTVLFCHIAQQMNVPTRVIAHRQELVTQISCTLNREKVRHAIRAPKNVIQEIIRAHHDLYGGSYYNANSSMVVESVDTSNARGGDKHDANVQLAIVDEGHHVLADNKWGKAMARYSNARGLFVTAHAVRADGAGLGRTADGLVDALVVGPCGRQLIDRGFLTDYRVACPESDVDYSEVEIGSTGDFNQIKLRDAVHRSGGLVGSVVEHYLKLAAGKLGITFAVDLAEADRLQRAYRAAGVPCAVVSAATPTHVRSGYMRQFRDRKLLQLISVDVLGEGVDVPALEVVSFARPTASWQLMCQQFGRALRVMVNDPAWGEYTDEQRRMLIAASTKPRALILDHVGNIARHFVHRGLPDSPQAYELGRVPRGVRKGAGDAVPLITCTYMKPDGILCMLPFAATNSKCPDGHARPLPVGRGSPAQVEGNLVLLDPAALDATYRKIAEIDGPAPATGSDMVAAAIRKNWRLRQEAQKPLRDMIALYAGYQRHLGRDDEETYRRFWYTYGVDVATAMTLGQGDALRLQARLIDDLQHVRVKE